MTEILIQVDTKAHRAFTDLLHLRPAFKQFLLGDERDDLEQNVCDLAVTMLQGVLATTSPYRSAITPQQELNYALIRCVQELGSEETGKLLIKELEFFNEPIVKETLCFSSFSQSR